MKKKYEAEIKRLAWTQLPLPAGGLTVKPQRSFESGSFLFFFGCYYVHVCFPNVFFFFIPPPAAAYLKHRVNVAFCRDDEQLNWDRSYYFLTCSLCCSPRVSWARPPRPISGCQSCDWCASSRPCRPSPSSAPEHPELPDLGYFKMTQDIFIYPTNMCTVK